MATHATDLATVSLCNDSETLYEFTGWDTGDVSGAADNDYYIHGNACHTGAQKSKTGLQSIAVNYGSDLGSSFAVDDCVFMWQTLLAGNAIDQFIDGGYRLGVGSAVGDFWGWITGGDDFNRNPYGGWQNVAVAVNISTGPTTIGITTSPSSRFTRSTGSFITDGWEVGMWAYAQGFTNSVNNVLWEVVSVAALVMEITNQPGMVIESGSGNETLQMCDYITGTPTGHQYFGTGAKLTSSISKGNLHGLDAIRWGRGLFSVIGSNATFAKMATANDNNTVTAVRGDLTNGSPTVSNITTGIEVAVIGGEIRHGADIPTGTYITAINEAGNTITMSNNATGTSSAQYVICQARFGLFQEQSGGYLWKGLMSLGTSGSSVTFSDSDSKITIDNAPRTYRAFNKIEIHNASSSVTWTRVNFTAVSTGQQAPGDFEMVDNATVTFTNCAFTDMGTFTFLSNITANICTFLRCGQVDSAGGDFAASNVLLSTVDADASAFLWEATTDPAGETDAMSFSKGTNAHHAIGFGTTSPLTMALNDIEFIGFSATNGQNDSTLYFPDRGSDVTWTINCTGCTGNITYKKARAGDTVTINLDQVAHTLTGLQNASEVTYVTRGAAIDTGSDGSSTVGSRNFVTTNAWTVDAYKGHLLEITSGADAGRYYVSGNSATTLYLDAELTATASTLTWELYDEGDDTETYHVESVTGNQTQYTYTYSSDVIVDIIIIHQDYEQIVLEKITLGNTSQSVPITQIDDVNYLNP